MIALLEQENRNQRKASELNQQILDEIKTLYGDQQIEIIIYEIDETDYLCRSEANKNRVIIGK